MPRQQVRDPNEGVVNIVPQARPVDTFVQPALQRPDTGPSELDGIAAGLSELNSNIDKYRVQTEKRFTDEQVAAGARAYQENRVSLAEATRKGRIEPGQNPHWIKSYQTQRAQNLALDYNIQLQEALDGSDVRRSDDPEAVKAFIAEFSQGFQQNNSFGEIGDEALIQGFFPTARQAESNISSQHLARRIKEREEERIVATHQSVNGLIDGFQTLPPELKSRTALQAQLQTLADEFTKDGVHMKGVNDAILSAVITRAVADKDLSLLDLDIKTGPGPRAWLSRTKEGAAKIATARTKIITGRNTDERNAIALRNAKRNEARFNALVAISGVIAQNPNANVEPLIAAFTAVHGPEKAASLFSYVKNARSEFGNDPLKFNALLGRVLDPTNHANPVTSKEVSDNIENHRITGEEAIRLNNEIAKREDTNSIYKNEDYRDITKSIRKAMGAGEFSPFKAESQAAANKTITLLKEEAEQFMTKNPEDKAGLRNFIRERGEYLKWQHMNPLDAAIVFGSGTDQPPAQLLKDDPEYTAKVMKVALPRLFLTEPEGLLKIEGKVLADTLKGGGMKLSPKAINTVFTEYTSARKSGDKTAMRNTYLYRLAQHMGVTIPDAKFALRSNMKKD